LLEADGTTVLLVHDMWQAARNATADVARATMVSTMTP
jgi:hypothetical protein